MSAHWSGPRLTRPLRRLLTCVAWSSLSALSGCADGLSVRHVTPPASGVVGAEVTAIHTRESRREDTLEAGAEGHPEDAVEVQTLTDRVRRLPSGYRLSARHRVVDGAGRIAVLREGDTIEQTLTVSAGRRTPGGVLVVQRPITGLVAAGVGVLVLGGVLGVVGLVFTATYNENTSGVFAGSGVGTLWLGLGGGILVGALIPGTLMLGFGLWGAPYLDDVPKRRAKLTPVFVRNGGGLVFEQTF